MCIRDRLGCCLYGYWSNGRLIDVCHDGVNIVLASVNDELTDEAVGGFVRRVGPIRKASAIMGSNVNIEKFFRTLASAWPRAWARPREIRARQPLLAIGNTSLVAADERVCRIGPENYRPYFEAAVKMYTEELGISPLDEFNSYQSYISRPDQAGEIVWRLRGWRGLVQNRYRLQLQELLPDSRRLGRSRAAWQRIGRRCAS